jgi:YHS domain-containing protein
MPRTLTTSLLTLILAAHALAQSEPVAVSLPAEGATPAVQQMVRPDRLLPVDPVMLKQGKAVAGDRSLAVAFEGNTYVFTTKDTRDTFMRDPRTYAATDAGACGRMGPLGGLGDARRYAIEEGLLYFFASPECMATFKANPHGHMEPYDQMPSGLPDAQIDGMAAFDRWVAYVGGKDAIRKAETYRQTSTERVQASGAEWDRIEELEITGPTRARQRVTWRKVGDPQADPTVIETILTPERAIIGPEGPGAQELYGTRRTAFERQLNRLPWSILRARVRPEAGLLVIRTGGGKLGPYDCDYVVTWFEGNATHLAIDKATGRMVQMGSMGRDTQSRVMSLTMDALGDAGPQALRLPTQWVTYPTGEKEGTKGPELTIVTGPATAPAAAPAAAAPVSAPAAQAPAPAPAPPAPR